MVLYTENSTNSTNNLLGLINEFSKIAGDKMNVQKPTVLLYTCNEQSKHEIKK